MRYTNRVIIFIPTDSQVFRHLVHIIIYLGEISSLQFIRLFITVLLRQTGCLGEDYQHCFSHSSCTGSYVQLNADSERITAVLEFMCCFLLCHISQDNHRVIISFEVKHF